MAQEINEAGLALIKRHEGLRLTAYQDTGGIWTIGYGHTGSEVHAGLKWTQAQADAALEADVQKFSAGVLSLITHTPTPNEFSAMVSLAYNIGLRNFRKSRVLFFFNRGALTSAASAFMSWTHDHAGHLLVELINRRGEEKALFLTP